MTRGTHATTVPIGTKRRVPKKKPNGISDDDVAKRAYEIYESRGGRHGADMHDWFEAEKQLTNQQRRGRVQSDRLTR